MSASEGEPWPKRPAIPLALIAFAVVVSGARLLLWRFAPGEWRFAPASVWWGSAAAVTVLLCLLLRIHRTRIASGWGVAAVLIVSACLAMALAQASLARQEATLAALSSSPVSTFDFVARSDASATERGGWWLEATAIDGRGRAVGEVWLSSPVFAARGDAIRGVGRFKTLEDDDFGLSSRQRAIAGTVELLGDPQVEPARGISGLLNGIRSALLEAIGPEDDPGRALVAGAALGDRQGLEAFGVDELFSRAGLAHLVAVSGLHVALATSLLGRLLLAIKWPRTARLASLALWGGAYVLLCGAPASALRSFAMAGAAQGADLAGRRAHSLTAVAVVGLAMTLSDVGCVGDLGFLLSATCVIALSLFSAWAMRLVDGLFGVRGERDGRRRGSVLGAFARSARGTLSATLVCLCASLPLVAVSYGTVSLLAPAAGIVAVPLFEAFLTFALVAALFAWLPILGPIAVGAAALVARAVLWLVGAFANLPLGQAQIAIEEPWATLATPILMIALYLLWPRPARSWILGIAGSLAAGAVAYWFVRPLFVPPRVVILDVGQGDSILIQDGAHAVLVDTGPGDAVASALSRQGVLSLDAVLLTHQHDDHAGGVPSLVGKVSVGTLLVPEGQGEALGTGVEEAIDELGCDLQEVTAGDRIGVGRFDLTILWPMEPEDGDENDESMVARLDYAEGEERLSALLTGDAESDVLGELERMGEVGDLDLLKVGHHGSSASVTPETADALQAEVAVASAGEGNSYGHPKPDCVETLEESGSLFLCTKDVGDVEVRPGSDGPQVVCAKG